jgi:cell division protein FtsL
MGNLSLTPPEILWLYNNVRLDYDILLSMRNESAIAALALHNWELYSYNNRIYTQLYKELSADNTLDDYCRKMQQSQANKTIAVVLLVIVLLAIMLAVVLQLIRALNNSAKRQQEEQNKIDSLADELRRLQLEEATLYVSNAVLDNSLSTLKHETMYYPSRIRQLVEQGDIASLAEVVDYYRELYGLLSEQAMDQTNRIYLRIKPLEHGILGDQILIDTLFNLLKKEAKVKKLEVKYTYKKEYTICEVPMPTLQLTEQQTAELFTPSESNLSYYICRQICRDHGEATNRRGCAIRAELQNGITTIIITLPRNVYGQV